MIVSFLLDESCSMVTVKKDTIIGFNNYIQTLKNDKNSKGVKFFLTKFGEERVDLIHEGIDLYDVKELNEENYTPNGLTPLYDVIGKTIVAIENKMGKKKEPVLMIIQTDGEENSSQKFTREVVFKAISKRKKKGWTFVFLGADQDAWENSGKLLNLDKGNVMSYRSMDTQKAYEDTARATCSYFAGGGNQMNNFYQNMNRKEKEK